ncbi:protease pro-enzyme activation domain-containing protein [Amycolatopsis rubida]|uniref:Putative Ig domain-containing protein n=1 Tax=Amycolatopsis rubida TaxID=112413 RepID=A0A1I6A3M7_9PSEU|nr:protease pro-enzyme activation domain-containing protein [Amycolatopsis rubida]SFQ63203.1 Putative Ig domain-containing protein [Amycolatopsis rubida]
MLPRSLWARPAAAAAGLVLTAALAIPGSAAAQEPRTPLAPTGSAPAGAQRLGATDPGREIPIALSLRPHDETGLAQFVASVSDPRSPDYRHFLSSADYAARYAPRESDVDAAKAYLEKQGLRVADVSANRQVVDAVGTVGQVEAAFGTRLGDYADSAGTHFYARESAPSVPSSVAKIVRTVTGLTNRPIAHRASSPAGPGGPGGGYTPAQFRTAYSMKQLSGSYDGSGQTVGLIEFDSFKQSDIDAWTNYFKQPSVKPRVVPVDGGVSQPGSGQLEVTLDIQAVAATAPGASQIVYEAPNSDKAWVDEMAKIASDNAITILSGSWLLGEKCESDPIAASHDSYSQMVAQGVTLLSASGDWGATGCGYNGDNSTVQADYPASDPLFTGVGGTQLRTSDSAGTYQSESCWNQGGTGNTRSGGGYSAVYGKPDWQPGTSKYRSVPDVALDADYGAGALSVYMNGGWQDVGGTSLSSPLWAGYLAMVNQKAKGAGKSNLGAINPTVYSIAQSSQYSSAFHDVVSGNNGTYDAGTGYDLCTGWGSMQGDNLADPLINGATPPAANDFSLAADPASLSVDPGKSATAKITTKVVKGSAQSVALSASGLPAGVTATFDPSSVTAGGTSTLTLAASSSASPGQSTVTVTGKAADATHTTPVTLTVNGSGQGDFSLSVNPASASVNAGQSATTTVSATAVNGAAPSANPSVINGQTTTVAKYPFIISEHRTGGVRPQEQSCTGTVVAKRAVLIAAHCKFADGDPKYLIYGRDNLNDTSKGARIEIAEFRIHPDYSPQSDQGWRNGNDVAIIFTKTDIPVPAGMTYPKIASSADDLPLGTQGTAIGYGKTDANDASKNTLLREVVLPTVDGSNCATIDSSVFKPQYMFCDGYGDGSKGLCQGDSGGQYYYNGKVYGVFSWLRTDCASYNAHGKLWGSMGDWANQQIGTTPPSGGDIALSAGGLPSGASATFDPASVDAGGSAKLTIATSASTPQGTYQVTITGKNATASHDTTFTLTVQGGSSGPVTVADPGFQAVPHGSPVHLAMRASGGTGSYSWSAAGLPSGLSIDRATGVVSGNPQTTSGLLNSTITAADTGGTTGKAQVSWFVY